MRLTYFYGTAPELAAVANNELRAIRELCASLGRELGPIFLVILLLSIWAGFMAGASVLHELGLRGRIARDGCPFATDADPKNLPGAREREMAERYC